MVAFLEMPRHAGSSLKEGWLDIDTRSLGGLRKRLDDGDET
jgi:hypothetical protein